MADYRALTIKNGQFDDISDTDGIIVGVRIISATGGLSIAASSGSITISNSMVMDAGTTLSTTSTGNIDLPNNASAKFKIETVAVSANVTAANLGTFTAGSTSNADSLHTHVISDYSPIVKWLASYVN